MPVQSRYPLRGRGPRTFISHSFVDVALAQPIADGLQARGFQTRMLDETVLIGKHLPTVLPQLIRDSEIVLLVLTEHANRSDWVRREFEWAQEHFAGRPGRAIIPVVLDADTLYAPIREIGYVSALHGADPVVVDLVARTGLNTVWALRWAADDPFGFDPADCSAMLASGEPRRIILDAEGSLLELVDQVKDTPQFVEQQEIDDDRQRQMRDGFLRQEAAELDGFADRIAALDAIATYLVRELRAAADAFSDFVGQAREALELFIRLTIGQLLRHWAQIPLYRECCAWMVARAERLRQFDAALDAAPRSEGDELVRWALAECDGLRGQPMKRVGINAQEGREGLYLLLPERVLGSDATVLLQIGQPPSAMISPHRWASLVLP